jgi:hypothetical protein
MPVGPFVNHIEIYATGTHERELRAESTKPGDCFI